MSNTLSYYISSVVVAISREDSQQLKECFTINPSNGAARASFPEPNDFDLYQVPEKFKDVIKSHLRLMKAVYEEKSIDKAFVELNDLVNNLIRAGDSQTNWINPPLINSMYELVAVYKVRESKHPEEIASLEFSDIEQGNGEGPSKVSALESLANTANKAFKLSLNDKNLDLDLSKRIDIYFFLSILIKIYFKMNKLELAKSIEKALVGTRFQLPDMKSSTSNKRSGVTYLYYSSLLSLDEADFVASERKLDQALDILSDYKPKSKQSQQVLLILLPLKLYNRRAMPSKKVWDDYPLLKTIYRDNLFRAINTGNIALFDTKVELYQTVFLKNHLYLLIELMRQRVHLNLVRKTTAVVQQLNPENKTGHIIPLNAYQKAFELSRKTVEVSQDEIECILASLISEGRIKGYMSHSNKCIVLSKTVAFP